MRQVRIEKITLNMGVGESGPKLEKAIKLLKKITGAKPIQTKTMKRIPTWNLRPNLAIGCKVTLRKKKAEEVLVRLLNAVGNTLKPSVFSEDGNFSFGVPEYIEITGVEYDPEIGIIGLEVAVTLERAGYRIKRRRGKSKLPKKQTITKQEAIDFMKNKFNTKMGEK
jgi:large subunit ribosomal protein L5